MPLPPGELTADVGLALRAWHWLGGKVDWSGIPLVAEILGIDDLEVLIVQLTTLRNAQESH